MAVIKILDKQTDRIVESLDYDMGDFSSAILRREINNLATFDFDAHEGFAALKGRNRVIIQGRSGAWHEFIIRNVATKDRDTVSVLSDGAYVELRNADPILPRKYPGATPEFLMREILNKTTYEVGEVDFPGEAQTIEFENPLDPYDALNRVANAFDMELRFRVEISGNRIVGRYVDLVTRLDDYRGNRIRYGKDLIGIERTEDTNELVTALLVVGPEPTEEGQARKYVTVTDEDAFIRWGRDGNHIWAIHEPQTEEAELSEERLRTIGKTELNKRNTAAISYDVQIATYDSYEGDAFQYNEIDLGTTILVIDEEYDPALYLEARIVIIEEDYGTGDISTVTVGDIIEYTEDDIYAQLESLRALMKKRANDAVTKHELAEIERQFEESLGLREPLIPTQPTPPLNPKVGDKWVDNSNPLNVLKIYNGTEWEKATPTEAGEIGAETPAGAQDKADAAAGAAKQHADKAAAEAERLSKLYAEQQRQDAEEYARVKAAEAQNQAIIDAAADAKAKADAALAAAKTDAEAKLAAAQQALERAIADAESGATSAAIADAEAKLAAAKKELQTAIGGKADANSVYTKTEVNTALNGKVSTTTYTADKNGIISRLDNAETSITQNADAIKLKASQESVDGVAGRITKAETTLTQHANALTSKAEKTIVDTLTGRVDKAETSITQQAGLIASKAEKSYVDTVSGVANSAKTTAEQTAEGLKTKAEKTEVTAAVADVEKYVQSRGENLVTNGYGTLLSNKNFSTAKFDGSEAYAGSGSFYREDSNSAINVDEPIPFDPKKGYRLKFYVKSRDGKGSYLPRLNFLDSDFNVMSRMHVENPNFARTTLTKDLNPGDTVIHVADASSFNNGNVASHYRIINFWNYANSAGHVYDSYTRWAYQDQWAPGGVDTVNNTITLRKPWQYGAFKAGHEVSTNTGGDSYSAQDAYKETTKEWAEYDKVFDDTSRLTAPGGLNPAIAYAKISILTNRLLAAGEVEKTWVNAVQFLNIDQENAAKDYANSQITPIKETVTRHSTEISQTAEAIKSKAEKSLVDAVSGVANTAKTLAEQTAEGLKSKAEKSSVDTLAGRVSTAESTLTQHAESISQRVTQTAFDTLSGRVQTAEGKITTMAGQITAKADKTVTDGLTTRMSTAESKIDANTSAITQRATKTEVNALTTRVGTAEQTLSAHDAAIKTKAEVSVTNGLNSRVTTAEQTLSAHGTQIATKVSQTDYNALSGRVSNAETAITQSQREIELRVSRNDFDAFVEQQMNLIPNPARTGKIDGWTSTSSLSLGIETVDFLGAQTTAIAVRSAGSSAVYSPYFDVDPAKAYEVTLWLKSEQPAPSANNALVGLNATPATIEHVDAKSGSVWDSSGFVFYSAGGTSHLADWTKITGYILPVGFDPQKAKGLGDKVEYNARMKPTTESMRVRFLNWGNTSDKPRTMWMTNAYVREVPPNLLAQGVREDNVVEKINLSPGTALIDFEKVVMTGKVQAKHLSANSVTAEKLNVTALSAISADLGDVTAGTIRGVSIFGGVVEGVTLTSRDEGSSGSGMSTVIRGGAIFQNSETPSLRVKNTTQMSVGRTLHVQESTDGENIGKSKSSTITPSEIVMYDGLPGAPSSSWWKAEKFSAPEVSAATFTSRTSKGDLTLGFNGVHTTLTTSALGFSFSKYVTVPGLTVNGNVEATHNGVFFTPTGYAVLRSEENGYVYLQGSEVRATAPKSPSTYVSMRALAFNTSTSVREMKTDIEVFEEDALEKIKSSKVYLYYEKNDPCRQKKQLGVMVDETDPVIHSATGDGINLYAFGAYTYLGVQQLIFKMEDENRRLEDEMEQLRIELQLIKAKLQ